MMGLSPRQTRAGPDRDFVTQAALEAGARAEDAEDAEDAASGCGDACLLRT